MIRGGGGVVVGKGGLVVVKPLTPFHPRGPVWDGVIHTRTVSPYREWDGGWVGQVPDLPFVRVLLQPFCPPSIGPGSKSREDGGTGLPLPSGSR